MSESESLKTLVYLDQNNLSFRYSKLDYAALLKYLNIHYYIFRATSYYALDHSNELQRKFVTYITNNGWRCETVDISMNTNIDNMLSTDMINDRYNLDHKAVVLISGDGDFGYPLNCLSKAGYLIHVLGPKSVTSRELLRVADKVDYLDDLPDLQVKLKPPSK